jgi:4'-phosphopantetheinyl transferase
MDCEWAVPPQQLRLAAGEVHVWRARLDMAEPDFCRIAPALSPDEHIRASRFRYPADRRAFLTARAALRHILGRYLNEGPAKLSFVHGAHGKPALAGAGAEWLRFNASHSHHLALYAVAREREVGVDVEHIQPELANWQTALQFFAAGEIRALRQLGEELQSDAFFACWTRKEACLKARGTGLSAALDAFEVTVACDKPARIVGGACGWSLQSLPAGEGFAAACAVQGTACRIRLWQWAPDDGILLRCAPE